VTDVTFARSTLGVVPADDELPEVPDPSLLDLRRPDARAALERFSDDVTNEALDWLFDTALVRPIHPESYPEARRRFFGAEGSPAQAPTEGSPAAEVLRTFRDRVATMTFNAQHPGAFSYFTPPPLAMSIGGEVLAQWLQQGVDVWHAGPVGAFVEEEVTRWLRELLRMPDSSWGVLTSGGVMANLMALTVAREVHLRSLIGASPRGAALDDIERCTARRFRRPHRPRNRGRFAAVKRRLARRPRRPWPPARCESPNVSAPPACGRPCGPP